MDVATTYSDRQSHGKQAHWMCFGQERHRTVNLSDFFLQEVTHGKAGTWEKFII